MRILNPTKLSNSLQGVASGHLRRGRRGLPEEGTATNTTAGHPTEEVPTARGATEIPTARGAKVSTAAGAAAEVPGERRPEQEEVRRLGEAGGELITSWKAN